ncbi:MAG: signal peptidase II [Thermoanaerobaculia bacterium]
MIDSAAVSPATSAPERVGTPLAGGRKAPFLLIALAVLAVDQWTKWLIETNLPEQSSRVVIPGVLEISHVRNTGVAFGLFASPGGPARSWWLSLFGVLALGLIAMLFRRTPAKDRLLLSALALVLGGAIGNLLDRIWSGAVTDFIAVFIGSYRWPDFNVADSAISIGLTLILFDSFRNRT